MLSFYFWLFENYSCGYMVIFELIEQLILCFESTLLILSYLFDRITFLFFYANSRVRITEVSKLNLVFQISLEAISRSGYSLVGVPGNDRKASMIALLQKYLRNIILPRDCFRIFLFWILSCFFIFILRQRLFWYFTLIKLIWSRFISLSSGVLLSRPPTVERSESSLSCLCLRYVRGLPQIIFFIFS